jgi:predicted phage gp36 major capsid-like protein
MRTLTNRLVLALALAAGVVVSGTPAAPVAQAQAAAKAKKPDMKKVASHLREHVKYPATRQEILDACAQTDEFTAAEKAWAAAHLPEGTYASADDVLKVLK